jgi:hypothetical protein
VAKTSGLGDNFYVAGVDLSGDTASLGEVGGGCAVIDVTGIDKSAFERIGGVRDGRIEWVSHFNPETAADNPGVTVDHSHVTLSSLPTTDRHIAYFRGTTLGNPAACLVAKQLNYDGTRDNDGKITFAVRAEANGFGLEWGKSLTAGIRTDTAATDGASVDFGTGSTAFGAQFYLQVFALDGDDCTFTVEQSSDDGGADAFAAVTGGAFTEVTAAPAVERLQTSRTQTVERYLRVVTSGTFTSVSFAVVAVRNDSTILF